MEAEVGALVVRVVVVDAARELEGVVVVAVRRVRVVVGFAAVVSVSRVDVLVDFVTVLVVAADGAFVGAPAFVADALLADVTRFLG